MGSSSLRIEDTDAQRNRAEHAEGIERAMLWLGLDWDEGPYFQSERGELYEAAIDHLLGQGPRIRVRLQRWPKWPIATRAPGRPAGYDGYCRDRGLEPIEGRLLRFRTPDTGTTSWHDIVRGEVVYENSVIEDFSVRKSNGQPLFILANVVDDGDMSISHVIRGEDHVPNTPKYLLLWDALELGHLLLSPTSRSWSTSPGKNSPNGGIKSPSRITGTKVTSRRPCSTIWPCSAGRPETTERSCRGRNSSTSSGWKTSGHHQLFSTSRNWRR